MADHAGELLWKIYALHARLRAQGADAWLLDLANGLCGGIGEFIKVPPPQAQDIAARLAELDGILKAQGRPVAAPAKFRTSGGTGSAARVERRAAANPSAEAEAGIALANEILELLPDVPAEGAEFAESVRQKVEGIRATMEERGFCTEKMAAALQNMLNGTRKWLVDRPLGEDHGTGQGSGDDDGNDPVSDGNRHDGYPGVIPF